MNKTKVEQLMVFANVMLGEASQNVLHLNTLYNMNKLKETTSKISDDYRDNDDFIFIDIESNEIQSVTVEDVWEVCKCKITLSMWRSE